jgi:putative ABC transport system permease protein
VCALVQRNNRLDPLIVGILMAFILHSLGLVVMGRPNIGLLQRATIFNAVQNLLTVPPLVTRIVTLSIIVGVFALALTVLLSTRYGLWLKAFGNNQNLVALLGKNPERLRIIGLALGNCLAALSGCLTAQASGYADINMGIGQALIGIAMILLGKELLRHMAKTDIAHDGLGIGCVFLGCIVYFLLTNELIRFGLNPVYLKMAIGIFLIGFLLFTGRRDAASRGFSS